MNNSRVTPHVEGVGRLMITNHGTHPPEFWAQVTAEQVAPIGPDVTGHRRIAALVVQSRIMEALEAHHTALHAAEQAGTSQLAAHPDLVADEAEAALRDVVAAAAGSEWEAHFARPEVQATARDEIARMFASHQHVERSARGVI